jgi:hypothetical protein
MRWLGWLIVAFVVWWIIEDPHGAALAAQHIAHGFDVAFTGISHFIGDIGGSGSSS